MAYRIKNLSSVPFDVPTLTGPVILPALGEITAELSAYEAEVIRHSPHAEIADDPLDHDGDGKKGGSKAPTGDKDAIATLRAEYEELYGKRPFNGWGAAKLQSMIDEKLAE